MVVDTSAVLAVFFAETHGNWAAEQLSRHSGELCMSTVNYTEILIILGDRQPTLVESLRDELLATGIELVCPDRYQAEMAAAARLRFPLNLGDCFAYALAISRDDSILAIDSDFRCVDCPVCLPPDS